MNRQFMYGVAISLLAILLYAGCAVTSNPMSIIL